MTASKENPIFQSLTFVSYLFPRARATRNSQQQDVAIECLPNLRGYPVDEVIVVFSIEFASVDQYVETLKCAKGHLEHGLQVHQQHRMRKAPIDLLDLGRIVLEAVHELIKMIPKVQLTLVLVEKNPQLPHSQPDHGDAEMEQRQEQRNAQKTCRYHQHEHFSVKIFVYMKFYCG